MALLILLLLASCAQVTIKDEPFFALKGPGNGAVEGHYLSSGSTILSQAQWDSISFGMFCMPYESFADWKQIIEELCSFNPSECNYSTQANITNFFSKVDRMRKHLSKDK
jgi:hypothetical protein